MSLFTSGADIDLKKIEDEIRKEIEEKKKRVFSKEELEELQNLQLKIPINAERIRTYFLKELDFEKIDPKMPEYFRGDYNIDLNTFLVSQGGRFSDLLNKLRAKLRPIFRLHGNMDALIHKQAIFNREQVQLNATLLGGLERAFEKLFHYIRQLHVLVNYLVAELTKLNLKHDQLKAQVDALAYDLDQMRKRERLILATMKDDDGKELKNRQ